MSQRQELVVVSQGGGWQPAGTDGLKGRDMPVEEDIQELRNPVAPEKLAGLPGVATLSQGHSQEPEQRGGVIPSRPDRIALSVPLARCPESILDDPEIRCEHQFTPPLWRLREWF